MMAARPDYQIEYEADAKWVPQSILGKTEYDLFLMDLMMPGIGGVELIRFLNSHGHQTPIIVLSSVEDTAVITQVLELGVMGYLPKSYSVYQIVDAIETCQQGNIHVPAFLSASLQTGSAQRFKNNAAQDWPLTPRQIEILSLLDKGMSNQQIADYLYISKATVKTHVNQMFKTLQVNNRVSCLRSARNVGLLSG